jgi:signal transduction histidine kinase
MKLQYRFILLLFFVLVSVGATLFIQHSFEIQRSQHILTSDLAQRKEHFIYYLNSEGRTFQTFSEDYSFWDDMVSFIKTDDVDFAHVNLDSGLSTFGADVDWVYRTNDTLLYTSGADPSVVINPLPLPASFFKKLATDKFEHFYMSVPQGILEVRAATIVPGDDPEHHDPASGFWVIGRLLGKDFTDSIGTLAQSTIKFVPTTTNSGDIVGNNSIAFFQPLKDWQDKTIEYLESQTSVSVISDLNDIYIRELLLLLVIGTMLVVLISLAVWRLILDPVRIIAVSIQRQQPRLLNKLSGSKSQLGQLAQVVQQFFEQKLVIQEDQAKQLALEKLNKEKSVFLPLAAHELKDPITVAKMLADELNELFRGASSDSRLFTNLDIIGHQIDKMMMLISDLRFASLGKAELKYKEVVFNFDDYLSKEIAGEQVITPQKLILQGSTGVQIRTDPTRLSQVVSNLIRNSSKYGPGTDKIIIRCYVTGTEIVTEVEDFGIGISLDAQAHIFERYYRSPDVAQKFQGLSSLGHGTHVYFSIPLTNAVNPSTDQKVSKQ